MEDTTILPPAPPPPEPKGTLTHLVAWARSYFSCDLDADLDNRLYRAYELAPVLPDLDLQVQARISNQPPGWMSNWHGEACEYTEGPVVETSTHRCGTVHCLAGWASVLAVKALGRTPEQGHELELNLGVDLWAAAVWVKSTGSVPKFFQTDDEATSELAERVAALGAP